MLSLQSLNSSRIKRCVICSNSSQHLVNYSIFSAITSLFHLLLKTCLPSRLRRHKSPCHTRRPPGRIPATLNTLRLSLCHLSQTNPGRESSSSLFAMNFLQATFESIENELKNVQWYRAHGYRIKPEYLPHVRFLHLLSYSLDSTTSLFTIPFCANGKADQKMKIKLGNTTVTAISDGGLSLYPKPTASRNHPILCIEVLFDHHPCLYLS